MKRIYKSSLLIILFYLLFTRVAFAEISSWNQATSLPNTVASNVSFTHINRLFVVGGANTTSVPLSHSALINFNGSLNNWSGSSIQSPPLLWHTFALSNNNIYLLGGATFPISSASNTIYVGEIDNNANIPAWTLQNPLPKNLSQGGSIAVDSRLYYLGGFEQNGTKNQSIYFAPINPNGTLGAWSTAGSLPTPLEGFGLVRDGNNLIVLGGKNNSGIVSNVWKTTVNVDGTIGIWTPLSSLPMPLYRAGIVRAGNTIVTAGGETTGGSYTAKVFYSSVQNDGSLSAWQESPHPLPHVNCCSPLAAWNNFVYLSGGHDKVSYFADVLVAQVTESNGVDLAVPLLKQTTNPWQDDIYDSANLWSPENPTVNRWGCAVTSATMVLNFHGINKISSTTTLDPGTLNQWLKDQPDGYVGNGNVNWLAISRLTKLAKPHNPLFAYNALEYRRTPGMNNNQLDNDLAANRPGILRVPGHFVVAKGKTADSYSINDPYYSRSTLNDGYNNEYQIIGRYIPSNTDLSYFMVVVKPEITVNVYSGQNQVPTEEAIEEPIIEPVEENLSGDPLKVVYVPQPDGGNYSVRFSSSTPGAYEMDILLYDKNGNVKMRSVSGLLGNSTQDEILVEFDKDNTEESTITSQINFNDVYEDIAIVKEMGLLNHVTAVLLEVTLKNAEKDFEKGNVDHAVRKIDLFIGIIEKLKQNQGNEAVDILLTDLEELKKYIQSS